MPAAAPAARPCRRTARRRPRRARRRRCGGRRRARACPRRRPPRSPGTLSSTTAVLAGSKPIARGRVQEEVGRRLAVGDLGRAEDAALEALPQPGRAQRDRHLRVRPARRDARRQRDPVERVDDARHRLELAREDRLDLGVVALGDVRRQRARRSARSAIASTDASERPRKSRMQSSRVIARPASVSSAASTPLETSSVSTSTPSQSKITARVTRSRLAASRRASRPPVSPRRDGGDRAAASSCSIAARCPRTPAAIASRICARRLDPAASRS